MSANSRLTTAIHALCWIELARRRGLATLTSEQVAASLASNPALVRRVLGPLRRAGILCAGRGPGSGWSLARPAAQIRLNEVHQLMGDAEIFALHAHQPNLACPVGSGIRPVLAQVYADAEDAVRTILASTTIADVLEATLAQPDGLAISPHAVHPVGT